MALLQLVQNFVGCYVNHSKTEQTNKDQSYVNSDAASMQQGHIIPANRDRIIASADEFPSDSRLNFVTKCIVNSANRNWRKEGKKVSYSEYRSFEKEYVAANPFARTITTIEGEEYEQIIKQCREHKISVNDYLVAAMMIKEQTNKVIIGANIRDRIKAGYFIPPISPSSRKIAGVLTVNNTMKQVVCDRMC